jgi:hypothetical protein
MAHKNAKYTMAEILRYWHEGAPLRAQLLTEGMKTGSHAVKSQPNHNEIREIKYTNNAETNGT